MKDKNILNYVGVFAVALLVAASAVYIYSPVIGSHAGEMTAKVSAVVNPVASLTLDTDNLEFNVSPTIDGSFNSGSITASVNTNSLGGYELYFSSEDNETNMVHDNESVTDVIASDFEGTVTSATMAANKWGYSLDNVDFLKIPALSNQATLRDIDHMPDSSEKNNTVYIGTKISTGLSSGSYSKKVVFSVLAHETPEPPATMQSFNSSSLKVGDSVQLIDDRDGNIYTVKKLDDGNVWMAENLRISDKTITSNDSNLPEGESYVIPGSDISKFRTEDISAVYIDDVYGGYYNFYTITAGWGLADKYTVNASPKDICPKGWRLPTGRMDEYLTLAKKYNTGELIQDIPGFTLAGYISNEAKIFDQGSEGYYWSGSGNGSSSSTFLRITDSSVDGYVSDPREFGLSVRCVAKDGDINDLTYMQDMTVNIKNSTSIGTSATLIDKRDNNTYVIKKIDDNNIWMMDNLRIVDTTITSSDSNLPDGESYVIPISDVSAFGNTYNVDAVYSDETYGAYYNFYTATAGWGTDSVSYGKSSGDICPKGWVIPDSSNFKRLYEELYNSYELLLGDPNLKPSGYIKNALMDGQGSVINIWSLSAGNLRNGVALYVDKTESSGIYDKYVYKTYGLPVRCIAK